MIPSDWRSERPVKLIRLDCRSDSFRPNFMPLDQQSEHSDWQDLLITDNKLATDSNISSIASLNSLLAS